MNYKELNKALKNNEISPVYLFTGSEQYVANMMERNLVEREIPSAFRPFNLSVYSEKNMDILEMLATCETLPMMSEKRMVVIKETAQLHKLSDKKELDRLTAYLEKPCPSTLLMIHWEVPDKRKKLYKSLLKNGTVVVFEKLNMSDLSAWINRRLKDMEKKMQPASVKTFIERSMYLMNENKTMQVVDNELSKLIDYVGAREEITKEDILHILPQTIEEGIFKLIDYAVSGQKGKALLMLNQLYLEGESPFGVFSLLVRQIRILLMVKIHVNKGLSPKAIATEMKLAPFIVSKVLKNGKDYSMNKLWESMLIAADLDVRMKCGEINQHLAPELFLMQLG